MSVLLSYLITMSFYFIYKINSAPTDLVKNLEKTHRFDSYKEAKNQIKALRNEPSKTDTSTYKIIFADSELDAEEKLQAKREAPILKEWEK